MSDPFDESKGDLISLLDRAEALLRKASQQGDVNQAVLHECGSVIAGAEEEYELLHAVVAALRDNGTQRFKLSQATLAERKKFVSEAGEKIAQMKRQFKAIEAANAPPPKSAAVAVSVPNARSAAPALFDDDDNEVTHLAQEQHEELQQQDKILDRIQQGVFLAEGKARTISVTVEEDQKRLTEMETNVDRVQHRLQVQAQKLSRVLEEMPMCGRMCLILTLMGVVAFLVIMLSV